MDSICAAEFKPLLSTATINSCYGHYSGMPHVSYSYIHWKIAITANSLVTFYYFL